MADANGNELKHSVHINRLHRWYEAFLTPTDIDEVIGAYSESDLEIGKIVNDLYKPLRYTFTPNKTLDNVPTASGNSALRAGSDEQRSLSNHDNEESPPQEEEENDREDDEFDDPSDEGPRRDNLWTYGKELEELLQTPARTTRSGKTYNKGTEET